MGRGRLQGQPAGLDRGPARHLDDQGLRERPDLRREHGARAARPDADAAPEPEPGRHGRLPVHRDRQGDHEEPDRPQPRDPGRRLPDPARPDLPGRGRAARRRRRHATSGRSTASATARRSSSSRSRTRTSTAATTSSTRTCSTGAARPATLRPVGLTIYGGPGNDLIIGSQTGDHLAGGSGDDVILGQRGQDHIYGDSGFNVDLITRDAQVNVTGTGPAGYAAAQFKNKDNLVAGNDLLYGEGPGSAVPTFFDIVGQDDDIIFGDLGDRHPGRLRPARRDEDGRREAAEDLDDEHRAPVRRPERRQRRHADRARPRRRSATASSDRLEGAAERRQRLDLRQRRPRRARRRPGNDAVDGGVAERPHLRRQRRRSGARSATSRSPRFQTLTGTLLYSRSDRAPSPGDADTSGALLDRRHRAQLPRPERHAVVGRVRRVRPLARLRGDERHALGRQLRQRLPRRQPGATTWSSASSATT